MLFLTKLGEKLIDDNWKVNLLNYKYSIKLMGEVTEKYKVT